MTEETGTTAEPCTTVGQAAREGRLEEIKRLIEEGHPSDGKDNRGWRPIHDAADGDHAECLEFLLQQEGCDVNWQGFEDNTALLLAAQKSHVRIVQILLYNKADPNIADNMQVTPLFAAVKSGSMECVRLLVENGSDVNCQQYSGVSPLHRAATTGWAEMIAYLVEKGAKLDVHEEYNITPLFAAAQFGYPKCLQLLLKAAKQRDEMHLVNVCADDGASPLFLAAQEGHAACVRMLLHYNADANLATRDPCALPLHAALQFGRIECIDALLGATDQKLLTKCDPNMWELATRDKEGRIIKKLIRMGLNINARLPLKEPDIFSPRVFSYFGNVKFSRRVSAISAVALWRNPIANAEVLLNAGADVNYPTAFTIPPLLPAIDQRCYGLAELLIAYGASVNIYHPLVVGNLSIILAMPWWKGMSMLLKCGAEVESLFRHPSAHSDIIPMEDMGENAEGDVTEPESSEEEEEAATAEPSSPTKRRKPSRYTPLPLYQTLRAASYLMKSNDVSVGKVVFRLLMFSNNVSLAADVEPLIESKEEWKTLCAIVENPRSLKHYCRWTVRHCLGPQNLLKIDPVQDLKLPAVLIDFVMYADLD